MNPSQPQPAARGVVRATRSVASALGIMVGVSGLDHGSFEILRGNAPMGSLIVQAIGPDQRMWIHGTEEAFTIAPNFLVAGILSVAVALAIIVWSIGYIGRPMGPTVFLALSAALFLVGGGVAMLVFVLFCWAMARRIDRPVGWWRALPASLIDGLVTGWRGLIVLCAVLYAFALEVAIAGVVPGVGDPEARLYICWTALLAMLASMVLAVAGAAAEDTR
ncbi:MAG: hypothetical protein ABSH20_23600 [Tepidisphaeraceae bacterium]|jgi:hypothetical protein